MKNFTPMKKKGSSFPAFKKTFLSGCLIAAIVTDGRAQASVNTTTLPSDLKVCIVTNASFTASATGSGTLSYQWQESTDAGLTWNNLVEGSTTGANPANGIYTGTTGSVLTITRAPSTMNGHKYQAIVYLNGTNPVASRVATLNVTPDANMDNANQSGCPGTTANLGSLTGATPGASYQWQVSTNSGSSWANVVNGADPSGVTYSGGATAQLSISPLTTAVEGYQYREIANDNAGCVITSGVTTQHVPTLASFNLPAAGTVTAAVGQSANIPTTITGGTGPFTYQWQVAVGAGAFGNINTANATYTGQLTSTLTIPSVTSAIYSNRYRVVVKNAGGCASSLGSFAQVGVLVTLPLAITGFAAERQGSSIVKLSWSASTTSAAFTVQRAGKGANFSDIANVVADGKSDHGYLDQGGVSGPLQYRVKAVDGNGTTVYSVVAEVTGDGGGDVIELRPSVVAGGSISLYTALNSGEPLSLTITDVTGRVLWSATVRPGKGPSSTSLDVARLGKGIYYLHAASITGLNRTMPFVKE